MQLVPHRFLFRVSHPCRYVPDIPDNDETLFHLPATCRLDNQADMDGRRNFADIRLAWNEGGLAIEVEVRGKEQLPTGDATRPQSSDGITLWVDTRDSRTSHRASRFCHQFHALPVGGGPERDEAMIVQAKIHRATQDAPLTPAEGLLFRCQRKAAGYRLALFLPAEALAGFDPEQNPRMGFFYLVRDAELGEQSLGAATDLPVAEDPTLWSVLELVGKPGR
ncbi:MAG: hypothetical protein U0840_18260 [Gemmataceae bacterium]